jgi:acyl-CoA synthetase (AMP-forming)/AMP-acid ligase II
MTSPLLEVLTDRLRSDARSVAIVEGKRAATFADLEARMQGWVARLDERGIGPGDAVLVYVPASIELYALLLAVWWRGGVAVFADAWTTRHRMEEVVAQTTPKAMVTVPKGLMLKGLIPELRGVPTMLCCRWRTRASRQTKPASVDGVASALVTFTTGSSGPPKGADRTHQMLMAQHEALARALDSPGDSAEIVTLPMFALHALAAGRSCRLAPIPAARPADFDPKRMLRTLTSEARFAMAASPAVFETLLAHLEARCETVDRPMHLHVGGALVVPDLMKRLRRAFPSARLTGVYGATEAEPIAVVDGDELAAIDPGRGGIPAGRPVAGLELEIIDTAALGPAQPTVDQWQRSVLKRGQRGEICVAGDHVLTGYYNNARADARHKIDAAGRVWHRTGDVGSLDASGRLTLHGTLKQQFAWQGAVCDPLAHVLELEGHDEIHRAAIVCGPRGPIVCVEPERGVRETGVRRVVARCRLPFSWDLWVGAIPRDPRHQSKVDQSRLTEIVGIAA